MVEIEVTDEFGEWYASLTDAQCDTVNEVVAKLEISGVALGAPHSSSIQDASFGLRELRPKRGQSPLRVFYAFDPRRSAMLIIGGDKSNDKRFYKRMIARCEEIWVESLEELTKETE